MSKSDRVAQEMLDEIMTRLKGKVPEVGPKQTQAGNEIIEIARKAVKEVGWEQAAFAVMIAHMKAMALFTTDIPNAGRPGQTIGTDERFYSDWQEVIGSMALMTAVLAERIGTDLKAAVPKVN